MFNFLAFLSASSRVIDPEAKAKAKEKPRARAAAESPRKRKAPPEEEEASGKRAKGDTGEAKEEPRRVRHEANKLGTEILCVSFVFAVSMVD